MKQRFVAILSCAIVCRLVHSQEEQAAFEVASFKLVASGRIEAPPGQIAFGPRSRPVTLTGNRVTAEDSLQQLLQFAYGIPHHELKGPDWLVDRRYQLAALVPEGTTRAQVAPMLKRLLTERLGLRTHWDERVQPVQALLIAAGGPKLTEVADPENAKKRDVQVAGTSIRSSMYVTSGQFFANAISLDSLARVIGNDIGETVINKTGLDKAYSIDARWSPHPRDGILPGSQGSDSEFPRARLKQLGLRLEKQKLARKILVDHADQMPVEN